MPTSYTTLLGLAKPATGELTGTWGTTVNSYITEYLDDAVAGAQVISGSQTAVTLSTTNGSSLVQAGAGASGSSQYAIIRCTGNPAGMLTITAPATSKSYLIINATSTSQSVKIVGAGPTTGVTIATGIAALVAWNGTDFALIASTDVSKLSGLGTGVAAALGQNVTGSDGIVLATSPTITTPTLTSPTVNTLLTVSGDSSLDGAVVINEAGADKDTRIEGDTDPNLLFADASTDRVGLGIATPAQKLHIQQTSATTNAVTQVLRLDSQSSGTPAIGIGVGMEFAAETSAGNTEVGVVLEAVTTDINAASEDFDLVFKTMQNGAAAQERVRIRSDGNVGVGTNNPTTILSLSRSSACVGQFANGTATAQIGAYATNVAAFGSSTNHPTRFLINGSIAAGIQTTGDFQFNSGYGSAATAYGCRAWINFIGSSVAIRGSGNVSSVTYNGAGNYTVNFATAMPDANFAVAANMMVGDSTSSVRFFGAGGRTASSVNMYCTNDARAGNDTLYSDISIFR